MKSWKFWLGLLVSAACIWYAFRDVDLGIFARSLFQANPLVLLFAMAWVIAVIWVRAIRWKILLHHLQSIPLNTVFLSALVGFGVNNLLPARIGEVARCYTLRRATGVRIPSSLATVAVERMWDGIALFAILLAAFAAIDFPDLRAAIGVDRDAVLTTMGITTAAIATLFVLFRYLSGVLFAAANVATRPFSDKTKARVRELLVTFVGGFKGIRRGRDWFTVIAVSLIAWLMSAAGFWIVSLAFDFDVTMDFRTLVMVLVAVAAAVTVPASPGYIGTYHVLGRKALEWGGYPPEQALALATVIHLVNYLPQTLGGLYGLKKQGLDMAEIRRAEAVASPDNSAE